MITDCEKHIIALGRWFELDRSSYCHFSDIKRGLVSEVRLLGTHGITFPSGGFSFRYLPLCTKWYLHYIVKWTRRLRLKYDPVPWGWRYRALNTRVSMEKWQFVYESMRDFLNRKQWKSGSDDLYYQRTRRMKAVICIRHQRWNKTEKRSTCKTETEKRVKKLKTQRGNAKRVMITLIPDSDSCLMYYELITTPPTDLYYHAITLVYERILTSVLSQLG